MSKYLLNKFLFTVDRDPDLAERYLDDPAATVTWWEAEMANRILGCHSGEASTWLRFDDAERTALVDARLPDAVRDGRAPVPDADAVHRDVRTRATTNRSGSSSSTRGAWPTSRCRTPTSRPDPARPDPAGS